jgi:ribosomal protein S12 methylthiotransferase
MKKNEAERPLRVGMISLGCAKNLVDAEIMLGSLIKVGIEITNDAAQADVMIVNTCSFIDAAQEESVDTILESAELREAKNRGQGLIVSGCLPQRFREELPRLLPEVDAFMGIDQVAKVGEIVRQTVEKRRSLGKAQNPKSKIRKNSEIESSKGTKAEIVGRLGDLDRKIQNSKFNLQENLKAQDSRVEVNARPVYIPDFETPRFRLTPKHFAYVKIAEGCNHPCSFCIIPRMRGTHRSRQQSDIVAEAKALIADGVKELNLISQDSTYYGLDLRSNHSRAIASPDRFNAAVKALPAEATTICSLLRELNELEGDFWIRLLYTHPAHWTDELIRTMAECPKVARYVDIPLQHIHENMLERMRRETTQEYIVELMRRIRAGVPGIALRTTFIVGFPGETEEYFESLLEFIRETKFERLGVFAYSQEEGTRAGKMAGQIPDGVRKRRRKMAMAAQHEVAVRVAESFVGKTMKVLVEVEASAKELARAKVSSWEHGMMRGEIRNQKPETRNQKEDGGDGNNGRNELSEGRFLVARGEADAPDIDGRIYVRVQSPKSKVQGQKPKLGEFARVKVVGHTDYDLIGEFV